MRPHIIVHMMSTIDGRITTDGWPKSLDLDVYETIHRSLKGDAWIVGRTTMAEFAEGEPRPAKATETYPRETWRAAGADKGPYAIALDRSGKLHLNRDRVNGDALVLVLTKKVSDDQIAELRRDGISYIFAGDDDIDLPAALAILKNDFAIEHLLLEGGGGINGSFLSLGLVDEISLLLLPVADGKTGAPTVFDNTPVGAKMLRLASVDKFDGGILHLRYTIGSSEA